MPAFFLSRTCWHFQALFLPVSMQHGHHLPEPPPPPPPPRGLARTCSDTLPGTSKFLRLVWIVSLTGRRSSLCRNCNCMPCALCIICLQLLTLAQAQPLSRRTQNTIQNALGLFSRGGQPWRPLSSNYGTNAMQHEVPPLHIPFSSR